MSVACVNLKFTGVTVIMDTNIIESSVYPKNSPNLILSTIARSCLGYTIDTIDTVCTVLGIVNSI